MSTRPEMPARRTVLAALLLVLPMLVSASPSSEVDLLLARSEPPPGVLFEVVSGDETVLERILPVVRQHAARLRERFPSLAVALITHGSEQFSLLSENRSRYASVHELVAAFEGEDEIPVHVCGNHASWRDKGKQDFPDYVDVASSASDRIRRYREAGFVVIVF